MNYQIELFDTAGVRRAMFGETPLLDVQLGGPDEDDTVSGLLPPALPMCEVGWTLRVALDGQVLVEAVIERVLPQWGDTRKLILDRYVSFHEVLEAHARLDKARFNPHVARSYINMRIDAIARDLLNRALGPVRYSVAHGAPPAGAEREYAKFCARRLPENALEPGGIGAGQWVDAARIDATGAYAKDGDTLAGLVVDGAPWPDLRLMMIDAEETSLNSHAIKRHPEVEAWDTPRYEASAYYWRGVDAHAYLQLLLDTHGIEAIELNPHTGANGQFDDRVDVYGRYLGLVYGGGQCFNAAMVESGLADVYLYDDGRYLVPEMALKEFYSYAGAHVDSIEACATILQSFDADAGLLELLAALAYAAPGMRLTTDFEGVVALRNIVRADRVVVHEPRDLSIAFGARSGDLANVVHFSGNPLRGGPRAVYSREDSRDHFGEQSRALAHFAFSTSADAAKFIDGLLDDLAYPGSDGALHYFSGSAALVPGDLVELREGPLRRLGVALPQEYGGRFGGRLVARVQRVRHRFMGRRVESFCTLDAPLRSVRDPLAFLVGSQRAEEELYALRLDDVMSGLDLGIHLD